MTVWLLAAHVFAAAPTAGGGIALGLFADRVDYDYTPLVQEIAATGASELLIAVPWSLPHVESHALRSDVGRGVLSAVIRASIQADLDVTVMPIVTVDSRPLGEWRGLLQPEHRGTFWSNYQTLLRDVAVDAQRGGAVRLVVGSELNSLEDDAEWLGVIDGVRDVFSGSVSYSANWDRYEQVPFWSQLDEVSVTAYFPIEHTQTWPDELARLHAFAERQQRPLVIAEYGYPALTSASTSPWDETTGARYDGLLQARLIDSALDALEHSPPQSHFLWNWFGTGAATEPSFTPRHRPASNVIRRRFTTLQRTSDPQ